mmetsp:Transcript_30708/g.60303  ORF Transcript_30708/g.60303 Transcript_30708/m.60303 type:complete len:325 (-) Transcript_30708:86-1060(-)
MELESAFKAASAAIEGKKGEAGVDGVGSLFDKIEGVKDLPGTVDLDALGQVKQGIEDVQGLLMKSIDDPSSLAPTGGCFAGCADWYGKKVSKKLLRLKDETCSFGDTFSEIVSDASGLMGDLSEAMSTAVPTVTGQVRELIALPQTLEEMASKLQVPADKLMSAVAAIDMKPVERSLDVNPMNAPLDSIAAIKASLSPLAAKAAKAADKISAFARKAPSRIRQAFDIAPCVPITSVAPPAMQQLLEAVKVLEKLDLDPLVNMLKQTSAALEGFDPEEVRRPITSLAETATTETQQLTDMVAKAKAAAGMGVQLQQGLQNVMKLF